MNIILSTKPYNVWRMTFWICSSQQISEKAYAFGEKYLQSRDERSYHVKKNPQMVYFRHVHSRSWVTLYKHMCCMCQWHTNCNSNTWNKGGARGEGQMVESTCTCICVNMRSVICTYTYSACKSWGREGEGAWCHVLWSAGKLHVHVIILGKWEREIYTYMYVSVMCAYWLHTSCWQCVELFSSVLEKVHGVESLQYVLTLLADLTDEVKNTALLVSAAKGSVL